MPKVLVDLFGSLCFLGSNTFHHTLDAQRRCQDLQYWSIPLVCALPLWFRFQQCMNRYYERRRRFPDVANAVKYALAEVTVVMAAFHPFFGTHEIGSEAAWNAFRVFWILLCVSSSLYSFWWDVVMDWGMIVRHPVTRRPELRKERLYPGRAAWPYWGAIVTNVLLRFLWTINIVPFALTEFLEQHGKDTILLPLVYFCELYRRFQWGIFRGE